VPRTPHAAAADGTVGRVPLPPRVHRQQRALGTTTGHAGPWAEEQIMQDYLTTVERLPDGSLSTTLYRGGRRVTQDKVRNMRQGKRRASDLLCTAVDTELDIETPAIRSSARHAAGALSAKEAAEVVRSAAASHSIDAALRVVMETALRSGRWDAASICVTGRGGPTLVAFTDERAAAADRLQLELGEGPCMDAVSQNPPNAQTERMIVAVDLGAEQRWPQWAPGATAFGFRGVGAVRLFTDRTLGSLNLYSKDPAGRGRRVRQDADVAAALASVVLATAYTERDLQRAAHSRGLIGQAQGILMQRYGLTAKAAFTLLRRYSQLHNTKMIVLAEELTTTGELPYFTDPHRATDGH
jgi:hypothetical protein